jgi:hypothetical protein
MKIELTSASRHNGGVAVKRKHGSSTVTEFYVMVDGVLWPKTVTGYGPTPGDRKTYARERVLEEVARQTPQVPPSRP